MSLKPSGSEDPKTKILVVRNYPPAIGGDGPFALGDGRENGAVLQSVTRATGARMVKILADEARAMEALTVEGLAVAEELVEAELLPLLRNLAADFNRGIVVIDETAGRENFREALNCDLHAGFNWKQIQNRLLVDKAALLRRAASLQGGGELIGVYPDGQLCLIDRADANGDREPVIVAFNPDGERINIAADSPNREKLLASIAKNGGRFANSGEIGRAVREDGFALPPDLPGYEKIGLVAAVEVVSGRPFVSSKGGESPRKAVLTKGQMITGVSQRAIVFTPEYSQTHVGSLLNLVRNRNWGAVRVLRG